MTAHFTVPDWLWQRLHSGHGSQRSLVPGCDPIRLPPASCLSRPTGAIYMQFNTKHFQLFIWCDQLSQIHLPKWRARILMIRKWVVVVVVCCTTYQISIISQSSSSLSLRLWCFLLRKLILGCKMQQVTTRTIWGQEWLPEWLPQSFLPFPLGQAGEPGHTWGQGELLFNRRQRAKWIGKKESTKALESLRQNLSAASCPAGKVFSLISSFSSSTAITWRKIEYQFTNNQIWFW